MTKVQTVLNENLSTEALPETLIAEITRMVMFLCLGSTSHDLGACCAVFINANVRKVAQVDTHCLFSPRFREFALKQHEKDSR